MSNLTKFPILQDLYVQWQTLAITGLPQREHINAFTLKSGYDHTFVAKRTSFGKLRIKSAELGVLNLFELEVRTMTLNSFFSKTGEETIESVVEEICHSKRGAFVEFQEETKLEKLDKTNGLVLLPIAAHGQKIPLILGAISPHTFSKTLKGPFEIVRSSFLENSRWQHRPSPNHETSVQVGIQESASQFVGHPKKTKVPYLNIVKDKD